MAYYLHWRDTEDPGLKLAVFSTGPAIRNYGWNLVTEIIGTFMLVFIILMIGAPWTTAGTAAPRAAADRPAGARPRAIARRPDGLRDQPGT